MSNKNRKQYRRTARILAHFPPILSVTSAALNKLRAQQAQFGFDTDDDATLSTVLCMSALAAADGWQDGLTVEHCVMHEGLCLFNYRAHMFPATADLPRQMAIELEDEAATAALDEFCVCSRVTAPHDASTSARGE